MLVDNLKASGHSFYEEQLGFAQEANLTSLAEPRAMLLALSEVLLSYGLIKMLKT
jgi:hypothetical protein